MFELVVIWGDGSIDAYKYDDRDKAESGMNNMKIAFGGQISYMYIRGGR